MVSKGLQSGDNTRKGLFYGREKFPLTYSTKANDQTHKGDNVGS